MSDIVIKAENLGKKYFIGHQAERVSYMALRDVLMQNAQTLWNKTKDLAKGKPVIQGDTTEEVWALKDVSFEIRRGEAIGIIGRNGAGKSTLLKVLSRITEPSAGRVTIDGRVASLLEVGTGFHPELTGRENIYLNGTILGMTRAEIKRKFDEIVAFAEIEKYLDTPVKRYSSGMYVRLAFAVAAHLEPEILVVDEVLAVGDIEFQKKCLGKMGNISKEGRTVLFVSHNMGAVRSLCAQGLLLSNGQLILSGFIDKVIDTYTGSSDKYLSNSSSCSFSYNKDLPLQILDINAVNSKEQSCNCFDATECIYLIITHHCNKTLTGSFVMISVIHNGTELIHSFDTDVFPQRLFRRKTGRYIDRICLPKALFKSGILTISIRTGVLNKNTTFQDNKDVLILHLEESIEDTSFKGYAGNRSGLLRLSPLWESWKQSTDLHEK